MRAAPLKAQVPPARRAWGNRNDGMAAPPHDDFEHGFSSLTETAQSAPNTALESHCERLHTKAALKRAIVIVLDGVGAGAAPDAEAFGDPLGVSTLRHVWNAAGGIPAPRLAASGLLSAGGVTDRELRGLGLPTPNGASADSDLGSSWGRLRPLSKGGKDSVTGHWEMMGIVLESPFPTYPHGFPVPLIKEFERRIGTQTLGNRPASGTQIIAELGTLHMRTGFPIVYTSADSVFQIACHEQVVPVERLYAWCRIARELCVPPHGVQRVIARPFVGSPQDGFTRTERRKDFPMPPPRNLVDEIGDVFGIGVVPELFCYRGFRDVPRTQSNAQHADMLWTALESDARFIFANFEDFDMLYGHRNDALGFARCLQDFDRQVLEPLSSKLGEEDLLMLTADHGNDPTDVSTDHTREYAPVAVIRRGGVREHLGDLEGMSKVGQWVSWWLGIGDPVLR